MRRTAPRAAGREGFRAELQAFGLRPEAVAAFERRADAAQRDDEIEMFAWLETALTWFLAAASQWRRDAESRPAGLDYAGAEAAARLAGLAPGPDDFAHLRVLEQAALAEIRRARGRRPA